MWRKTAVGLAAASFLLASCAESIHQRQRMGYESEQAGPAAPTGQLSQDSDGMTAADNDVPLATKLELQQGQAVTLSGTVLRAKRLKGMTEIEVLYAPLRPDGRPAEDRRLSQGRFLARQTAFLDPAILAPRPMVTVRGMVEGEILRPLEPGADDYAYPLIAVQELTIWPVELLQPWSGASSPPGVAASAAPASMVDLVGAFLTSFVRALFSPRHDAWSYSSSSSSSSGSSAPASRPSPPPERIPPQFQKGR